MSARVDWLIAQVGQCAGACMDWPFALNHKGYGRVFFGQRQHLAHRVALALHHGYCPPDLEAAHTCHNRKCVNPHHLYWATSARNKLDCLLRGTQSRKISAEQALAILNTNTGTRHLADALGITTQAVRDVRAGRSWGWLKAQSDVKPEK